MFVSELEISLIQRMANNILDSYLSDVITQEDIDKAVKSITENNNTNRFDFCSSIETASYCFSILLSEVRDNKREVMTALFNDNPKLAQEKSVLKEKLDAEPEYASLHGLEEQLFQIIEHLTSIKNNVTYLLKDEE